MYYLLVALVLLQLLYLKYIIYRTETKSAILINVKVAVFWQRQSIFKVYNSAVDSV